mmetsp:Transcript_72960/g.143068  ORF Transcript_72960/g.143068 Transcript_72960/m.143068 type:complete len:114 (+) Transcript_72960:111-452(+)
MRDGAPSIVSGRGMRQSLAWDLVLDWVCFTTHSCEGTRARKSKNKRKTNGQDYKGKMVLEEKKSGAMIKSSSESGSHHWGDLGFGAFTRLPNIVAIPLATRIGFWDVEPWTIS